MPWVSILIHANPASARLQAPIRLHPRRHLVSRLSIVSLLPASIAV